MMLLNKIYLILYSFSYLISGIIGNELLISYVSKPTNCDDNNIAKNGDSVSVHYTGRIDESSKNGVHGKVFDSSLKRSEPFSFTLGTNQVIKG